MESADAVRDISKARSFKLGQFAYHIPTGYYLKIKLLHPGLIGTSNGKQFEISDCSFTVPVWLKSSEQSFLADLDINQSILGQIHKLFGGEKQRVYCDEQ